MNRQWTQTVCRCGKVRFGSDWCGLRIAHEGTEGTETATERHLTLDPSPRPRRRGKAERHPRGGCDEAGRGDRQVTRAYQDLPPPTRTYRAPCGGRPAAPTGGAMVLSFQGRVGNVRGTMHRLPGATYRHLPPLAVSLAPFRGTPIALASHHDPARSPNR